MHTSYESILRTWQQADELPEIEHAWLWDHMLPLTGPKDGPALEGWTLLTALAAQTRRLRLGLLVTNNQIRQPAVLGKIASTLDIVSGGRWCSASALVARCRAISETIAIVRRMFTEDVFDFDGRYYSLSGTRNEPKPIQRPGPPVLVGGTGTRLLRVVAEQADIWNIPGPPHASLEFVAERGRVLDQHCADIGRDPAEITRSVQLVIYRRRPGRRPRHGRQPHPSRLQPRRARRSPGRTGQRSRLAGRGDRPAGPRRASDRCGLR